MNAMNDVAEARASALSLRASAKACTPEQGALKFRLTRAAESLDAMVLLAVRALDRIEQLEGSEMPVRLAQALLEEARVAAEGGHRVTHDLQRQARELIGAALDRCAVGRSS